MYSFHRYRSDYRLLPKLGLPFMVGQFGNYNRFTVIRTFSDGSDRTVRLHSAQRRDMVGLSGRAVIGRVDDDGTVQVLD